jgi:hypothetical protein
MTEYPIGSGRGDQGHKRVGRIALAMHMHSRGGGEILDSIEDGVRHSSKRR